MQHHGRVHGHQHSARLADQLQPETNAMPRRTTLPTTDELITDEPQAVSDSIKMPLVWADHQVTRRQRIHGANFPGGTAPFTSTHFSEVLEYLAREGWTDAILICETPGFRHVACYIEFKALEQ